MSRDDPKTTDYCATCGESPDSGSHLPGGHDYAYPNDREPWRDYLNGLPEVGNRYPLTEQELDAIADGAARTHTFTGSVVLDLLREILRREVVNGRPGVDDPCVKCRGQGTLLYGSTATWRGGMGGASMTHDVCDSCWGSGDRYHTWCNLRRLRDEEEKRVAERSVDLLAKSVGASLSNTHRAIVVMVEVLEKLATKRGAPAAPYLPELAQGLANTLRRAVGAPERK